MNTQTQVEIKKAEVGLIQKMNKLLEVMNIMQDNITELAKRVVELEKRQK